MPAILLLMGLWLYFGSLFSDNSRELRYVIFYSATFLTLPVIGLYQSLARTNFFSAFVATLLLGVVAPVFLVRVVDFLEFLLWMLGQPNTLFQSHWETSLLAIPLQCLFAGACVWQLHHNLKLRRFALESH